MQNYPDGMTQADHDRHFDGDGNCCDGWHISRCEGSASHTVEWFGREDLELCEDCAERFDTCVECGGGQAFNVFDDTNLCAKCVIQWFKEGEIELDEPWTVPALTKANEQLDKQMDIRDYNRDDAERAEDGLKRAREMALTAQSFLSAAEVYEADAEAAHKALLEALESVKELRDHLSEPFLYAQTERPRTQQDNEIRRLKRELEAAQSEVQINKNMVHILMRGRGDSRATQLVDQLSATSGRLPPLAKPEVAIDGVPDIESRKAIGQ